jgi:hypothetical protein
MEQSVQQDSIDGIVETCMRLLMAFQRKEQLPRKFTDEDWVLLRSFETELQGFMQRAGKTGEEFLATWRSSPLDVKTREEVIETRQLKRCLKMLVAFRDHQEGKGTQT